MLTLQIGENTPGLGGLSLRYTLPMAGTLLPDPSHGNSPLSQGVPEGHRDRAFLLGLRDPQGLSFLEPPQHRGPPETHRKNLSSKAEEETEEV